MAFGTVSSISLSKLSYPIAAVGNMSDIDRHQNITFSTLEKGYTESGIEINKLILGFGLSFAYRYGAYHLPKFQDNIAFKFTFNLTL